MYGALARELAQAEAKAGLLQNQFACHKFPSVLNHSTLEFRDFSKRAPGS